MEEQKNSSYNRSLIESTLDPLVTIGSDGKITDVNRATENITGLSRDKLIGTDFSGYFKDPKSAKKGYEEVFKKGFVRDYPLDIKNLNGKLTPVLYNATIYKNESGKVLGVFAAARDITERKVYEANLSRTLRALKTISKCNEILVRAVEERDLLKKICEAIVEYGGYRMAWVGYAQDDPEKRVLAIEQAGFEKGYLEKANIVWSDTPRGRGPTGTSIRTGKVVIEKNIQTDPKFEPWRKDALARGYQSSIALPLPVNGTLGALTVYATEPDAFDKNEVDLLTELSRDLSFGIKAIRNDNERSKISEELRVSSIYNRNLIEASLDPLVTIGPDGKITDVNRATEVATGLSRDELIGTDFSNYFTDPKNAEKGYKEVFKEGFVRDYPLEILHKKGKKTPVLYNASLYKDEKGRVIGVFAAARDITRQKQAEEQIQKSEKRFRETLDNMLEGCMIIDFDWKYVYVNEMAAKHGHSKKENLIGKTMMEVYPGVDKSEVFLKYKKCMIDRKPQSFESSYTFKNEETNWYEFSVQPSAEGIFVLSIDITKRKNAEKEVFERTEELQKMNNLMIGRELRMIELKKKIRDLEKTS